MPITAKPLAISDVVEIMPTKIADERGFFSEVYNQSDYAAAGINVAFVQDNHSLSGPTGTVRGLHFQVPPFAQAKLVRVTSGAILDIAVDIRNGSPTFGQHVAIEISAENWKQVFVPAGFAHGFCTLAPDTEVIYKVDQTYSRDHDRGLLWNDPQLNIDWPVREDEAVLSERDQQHPALSELPAYFHLD